MVARFPMASLLGWLLLMLFLGGCSGEDAQGERPNFLFVVSDQQHYQALGVVDGFFTTPNLDALAGQSVFFTRAFVSSPQCSPSRSSLYTGLYPHKTGVIGNTGSIDAEGNKIGQLPESLKTIGEYLKPAGYRTAYIGKWHLGEVGRHAQGYDVRHFDTFRGGDNTSDSKKSELAMAFLAKMGQGKKQPPFALFLNYTDPHDVYEYGGLSKDPEPIETLARGVALPQSYYAEVFSSKPEAQSLYMERDGGRRFKDKPEDVWKSYRGFYRAKVQKYDTELGKVIQALKDTGEWERTIVIVTSDHGDMDARHHLVFKGPFAYEQVIRVPLMIRVPSRFGAAAPRKEDAMTVNVDILPTILDFAGLPPTAGDGVSLKPLLLGTSNDSGRKEVVVEYYNKQKWVHPLRVIRSDRYKYVDHLVGMDEFYDLQQDPDEIHNLIDDPGYGQVREQLSRRLGAWIEKHSDPF
ncbi:sulfatase family protein, partial [Thiolapillus sp.]